MSKVLVLNASYEPLNVCSWRRAMVLLLKGKAESLEHNGRKIYGDKAQPTVIRLRHFVRVPYRDVALTRRNILHRDGYACQYCGRPRHDLTIDHVYPRSRGGADIWENVITSCTTCNVKKGNRTPEEANMRLLSQPRRPASHLFFEVSKSTTPDHMQWRPYLFGAS